MSWRPSRTLLRYIALQSPGWVLAALALYASVEWGWIRPALALPLWGLWIAKDFALYPWLRTAYEDNDPGAGASLVGRLGRARERLGPRGYVVLGSELWRAELAPGRAPIEADTEVRVVAVRGLTLLVEPARPD